MAKKEKFSVSLSTLAGSSFPNFLKTIKGKKVDKKFRGQLIASMAFSLVCEPFRAWENLRFGGAVKNIKIDKPPVFVLGHWRSGTTHLHNLLCQDPQFGYVTTFHGVFPHLLFSGKGMFKKLMGLLAPETRPSDNMKLSFDFPQEEEFAIGNTNELGYYKYWYFPKMWMEFFNRYVLYEGLNDDERESWKEDYITLAKKALKNTNGKRFISKNPPHTAKIKLLLETFPDAKFIHIYRNPITIFQSTKKLITSIIPALQFQEISEEQIDKNIFEVYTKMMNRYELEKSLIPNGNLVEVKFEDFEKDNLGGLQNIYNSINLPGFEDALPHFKNYVEGQKKYQKNKYKFTQQSIDNILKHWQFAMDRYNYDIPENIEIVRETV